MLIVNPFIIASGIKNKKNTMKLLSVIIVTYNSQDLIEKCLNSIFANNDIGDKLQIIIVDNSAQIVSNQMFDFIESRFPNKVMLLKNDRNGGYGQGNNLGIKQSLGKYIAIMNPDITMTEPLFAYAINYFVKTEKLGMLGFKQYGAFDLSYYIRQEFIFPLITPIITKFLNKVNIFSSRYMYLSGAFLFVEKESFYEIGLFDENIFLYCEESDITKRILNAGMLIRFEKSKSYIHEIDGRLEMSDSSFKFLLDSIMYYLTKFSFNKKSFLNKTLLEFRFKKMVYSLLNNRDMVASLEMQIKQTKLMYNSIIKKYN